MNQIYTSLDAKVEASQWDLLKQKYAEVKQDSFPSGLLSSHLVQDTAEPKQWRIVTIWNSRAELDVYRKSVETPAWILVFRAVQTEPRLFIGEIVVSK